MLVECFDLDDTTLPRLLVRKAAQKGAAALVDIKDSRITRDLIRFGNDFLFSGQWWVSVFPGVTLILMILAINLLGDWLRDALNPRLR